MSKTEEAKVDGPPTIKQKKQFKRGYTAPEARFLFILYAELFVCCCVIILLQLVVMLPFDYVARRSRIANEINRLGFSTVEEAQNFTKFYVRLKKVAEEYNTDYDLMVAETQFPPPCDLDNWTPEFPKNTEVDCTDKRFEIREVRFAENLKGKTVLSNQLVNLVRFDCCDEPLTTLDCPCGYELKDDEFCYGRPQQEKCDNDNPEPIKDKNTLSNGVIELFSSNNYILEDPCGPNSFRFVLNGTTASQTDTCGLCLTKRLGENGWWREQKTGYNVE
ncbi:hypothetical protein M3Y94_01318200 [Aphelenchoides besseyi]|nr:hypothetical protein M3Y94_01318200 [Aphelenchoides besseyi]